MNNFNSFITDLVEFSDKKVILIIDKVDKSNNNQLFLDFLGILKSKYLLRNEGKDYTFIYKWISFFGKYNLSDYWWENK